jgi:uncharacterized protein (DUF58 family)
MEGWAARWARRRQGLDSQAIVLRRKRIYILPTRFGVLFGCMTFAMLLGSLNYGASLGFTLTFLLAGLALVMMHHCHNNLLGLRVRFVGAAPVFAGERAEIKIAVGNDSAVPRYEVELSHHGHTAGPIDIPARSSVTLELGADTERRGWLNLERFAVITRHPGRLFRAWTWMHMEARCLVYPQPSPAGRPLPLAAGGGHGGAALRGDEDFAGLRAASPGDPPQRIAWKAYARNDMLMLKQFADGDREPCLLDWDLLPGVAPEERLSQLTRWCLDAEADGRSFGLRLPGRSLALGTGVQHLAACLEALALFEAPR